jgi:hypothetical protein
MSEDKEKHMTEINELVTAIVTTYVRHINKHRDMDNASVVAATAFFMATIVDALSFEEGDPPQTEVLAILTGVVTAMLEHPDTIRSHMKTILLSVMAEELRQ